VGRRIKARPAGTRFKEKANEAFKSRFNLTSVVCVDQAITGFCRSFASRIKESRYRISQRLQAFSGKGDPHTAVGIGTESSKL